MKSLIIFNVNCPLLLPLSNLALIRLVPSQVPSQRLAMANFVISGVF
jgi:hypothetical protein